MCLPAANVTLQTSGVRVELTAASRATLQRHSFPVQEEGTVPRFIVDVSNAAGNSGTTPLVSINTTTGRITALAQFQVRDKCLRAYFCTRLPPYNDNIVILGELWARAIHHIWLCRLRDRRHPERTGCGLWDMAEQYTAEPAT